MPTSARVAAARDVARVRQTRERRALRLLGLPLLAVVVVPSLTAQPAVAAHGRGLVVATALVCLVGAFAFVLVQAPRLDRLQQRSSVSTVLLEGARLTAERGGASTRLVASLARCRRLAAQGLEDATRAVRTLRGDEVPGLRDLDELLEGFREAGLAVAITVRGERRKLRPEAELAVYRAAQEALTNVVRHSAGDHADVELRLGDGEVRLVVTDSRHDGGAPADAALAAAGSGYGLSAMRERAQLLGGSVEAGPTEGGFRVELQLPA